ncbi:MAG: ABC transporter permease [Tannerella sp.]|jgi:ABC-2 type transport system permease protein|nr:ABC transporter permease [Tannerella sp.]
MKSKIALIIRREYLSRISRKSFIVLTLLMPVLMAAISIVPLWLASIKSDGVRRIAVIDRTGKYAPLFENMDGYRFFDADRSLDEYRERPDRELFTILSITDDLLLNPQAATLYSEKQIPGDLSRAVNRTLGKQMESDKVASYGIPDLERIIRESRIRFDIQTVKWGKDGEEESHSPALITRLAGITLNVIIYMFIMMYGGMVMQAVMEEKTSRIVEIMVSSVRPFDLMMGKIVGIGLVGLTQLAVWGILGGILLGAGGIVAGLSGGLPDMASLSAVQAAGFATAIADLRSLHFLETGFFFVAYFIGGYLLYGSFFAAIGSAVNHPEDAQPFMAPVMIILMFALYIGIYSMENPDGPVAFWCSFIPLTSPIVMLMRISNEIPAWEKILSIALLYAAAGGFVWMSAKIYRVGILVYGKKPSFGELIRWISFR